MTDLTLYVPRDSAAVSVGADEVAQALRLEAERRGQTLRLIRNGSRGMFWLEPLVEVEMDAGRVGFGPVRPGDVASLFDAAFPLSGHPLSLGVVDRMPWLTDQERLTFARNGVIDPTDLVAYQAHGGLAGLKAALALTPQQIVDAVKDSGLRGRGGAGFPTGIKWQTVLDQPEGAKYVACNADEGDSGTFADRMVMEGDPCQLIEGMVIAGLATGAETGYVYIRSEYPTAIATMKEAAAALTAAGWLGADIAGSGRTFHLHIRTGAGAYICGEESSMLESLEGKRGQVRAKPPIPAIQGLFGRPTVVNNVLTLATVPVILAKGAAFYRDFGVGRSRGTNAFQLAGNVRHGGLVEKAFGVSVRTLVEGFGGGTLSGRPVKAIQLGGPLGAYIRADQMDLPMDYEVLAENQAMLGHGGLVIHDDTADLARLARFAMAFCAIESCGKCTPCRIGAVRGTEVLDRIIAGQDVAQNLGLLEDLCEVMTDGSLCAMGGLTPMPVRSAVRLFPEDFAPDGRVAPAEAAQ